MSYDVHLYLPVAGESASVTARKDPPIDVPLSAEAHARNRSAFRSLKAFNADLELFEFDTGVQITAPDDGSGISIELFNDSGSIGVPYWHEAEAEEVLGLMGEYLKLVHSAAGFCAYDPQTETLLDPAAGFGPSPAMYSIGVHALSRTEEKPWWRFW